MSHSGKRSLIFIILFLLLTNIGVLAYFLWFDKDKKPPVKTEKTDPKNGIAGALQKDVGFDEQQVAEYRKLKEKQWAAIKPMFEDMRRAKDSLYKLLSHENAGDSLVNATADAIARKQRAIDLQAFTHFRQIRELCRPDQLVKYDSLVQRLVRKMGRPQRGADSGKKEKSKEAH